MSLIPSESAVEGEEEHPQQEGNPEPPSDEFFDITTTVDPGYVISLIRKLLPADGRNGDKSPGVDACDTYAQISEADGREESVVLLSQNGVLNDHNSDVEAMDTVELTGYDGGNDGSHEKLGGSLGKDAWEECGCILWDLAASKTHAEFMVQNLILEVLLANLMVPQSVRTTEIMLGIIGNIACHEVSRKHIAATNGLIAVIVDQLFLDDTPCLCEAYRYSVLDVILRTIEALSVIDDCSKEVSSSTELFRLLIDLVKFPDKIEVANSCVTAAVLIANILTDVADLALEISPDFSFLQGLFDVFPFASDDIEARIAIWSIIERLLVQVQVSLMTSATLHHYVSVFVSKSEVIEDELLDHQLENCRAGAILGARITALRKIISILSQWTTSRDFIEINFMGDNHFTGEAVDRLLERCHKYTDRGMDLN